VKLLISAAQLLQCNLEWVKNSPSVNEADKLNRDILLYLLWQKGRYTNLQIGVSRRVVIMEKKWPESQS
jgi:hypothetical protein